MWAERQHRSGRVSGGGGAVKCCTRRKRGAAGNFCRRHGVFTSILPVLLLLASAFAVLVVVVVRPNVPDENIIETYMMKFLLKKGPGSRECVKRYLLPFS